MEYKRGIFGVLNQDDMEAQPLILLDGGVERRCGRRMIFPMTGGLGMKVFSFSIRFPGKGYLRGIKQDTE